MKCSTPLARSFLLAAAFFSVSSLPAASVVWDTNGLPGYQPGDGTWDALSPNWTTDGVNLNPWVAGDTAVFYVGTQASTDAIGLASTIDIGGLTFGGGTPYSPNWSISGTGRFNLVSAADITVTGTSVASIGSAIDGGFGFRKAGSGGLILGAANTYSGGTTLDAGQLQLRHAQALGSGVLTMNGGSLSIGSYLELSVANGISLLAASSTFDFQGTYFQSTSPYTSTLSGEISGAGAFVKTGSGNLSLGGLNTYSGGTTINQGRVTLRNNQAAGSGTISLNGGALGLQNGLSVANGIILQSTRSAVDMDVVYANGSPYDSTLAGLLSGSGTLVKTGRGMVNLSGTNTYTGGTSIEAGYLQLKSNQAAGTGAISLNGGTLALAQNLTVANAVVLRSVRSVAYMDVVYGNGSPYDSTLSGVVSGAGTLVKTGRGMVNLSGTNTYTGGTSIEAGYLQLKNNQAAGTGAISLNGGTLALSQNLSVANDIVLTAGVGGLFMDTVYSGGSPYTSTLTGIVSGLGLIQKTGKGNVTLKGQNTYAGGTSINAGWLTLGNSSAAGSGDISVNGGSLYLQGGVSVANSIVLSAPQSSLGIEGTTATSATVSGVISGTGVLNKDGGGSLVLTAANTYTGGTSVNTGALLVNGSILGNVSVAAGASLGGSGVVGAVQVSSGGRIGPGATSGGSVASLTATSLKLEGGSILNWDLSKVDQAAGVGYDCMKVTGLVDLSSLSPLSKVNLVLTGVPTNFDAQATYRFLLLDYGSLNLGTNANVADLFAIDVTGLKDKFGVSPQLSAFSVTQDVANQQLILNYAQAIPEPSTYGFSLGALSLLFVASRRRSRRRA